MPTQRKGSVQGIQRPQVHVVTGGGGFPGFSLGKKLSEKGHQVRLFDIREPAWKLHEGMNFIQVFYLYSCKNVTNCICLLII